jgi:hypothetical protein
MNTIQAAVGIALGYVLALALPLVATDASAQGAVYRCLDENQRPQYTNVKADTEGKQCIVVTREVSVVAPGAAAPGATPARPTGNSTAAASQTGAGSATPAGFPRVDAQTQRSRDDSRRKILEDELSLEERSLARARQELAEQQALAQRAAAANMPSPAGDRTRPLVDSVERHERNIAAIRKELGNIR